MSYEEPKERTTVTLPRSVARRLSAEARASGRPVSGIVRDALQRYFAEQGPPPLPSFTGIASGSGDVAERADQILGGMVENVAARQGLAAKTSSRRRTKKDR